MSIEAHAASGAPHNAVSVEHKASSAPFSGKEKPLILVIGGTGKQGNSICKYLASSHLWRVRTITRDANAEAARELKNLGIEVIQGSFEDLSLLKQAMTGAYGVFSNLDYWKLGEEKELKIGTDIVDVAASLDIKHFIYSTLEYINKHTAGRLTVPFFDNKGKIAEYALSKGLPCTFVKYSSYCENFLEGYTKLQQDSDGCYLFKYPLGDKAMALIPVHQAGKVIAEAFKHPEKSMGKSIGLAGDFLTGKQMAEVFQRKLGRPARSVDIPLDEFAKSNPQASVDMWRYKQEFESTFARYVEQSREYFPEIETFEQWLDHWPA